MRRRLTQSLHFGRTLGAFLLWIGLALPLVAMVLFVASVNKQDAEISLDTRLTDLSSTVMFQFRSDLEHFREILLTSAQNPAMREMVDSQDHHALWKKEIDASLTNLTAIFPGMIDEVCRIDANGVELSRVTGDGVASDSDLSPDESANPFLIRRLPCMSALCITKRRISPPIPIAGSFLRRHRSRLRAKTTVFSISRFHLPTIIRC